MGTQVQDQTTTGASLRHEDLYQVILHNDTHNTVDYVVMCLMRVFGHNEQVAEKIMWEAHRRGRAVAEVEDESRAKQHKEQLLSCHLEATIEKL